MGEFDLSIDEWRQIINRCDPVFLIDGGAPDNEYDFMFPKIATKVTSCKSIDELAVVVREVFASMYGSEMPHEDQKKYRTAAEEIWTRTNTI